MPGHILMYQCPCGFEGEAHVGVSGLSPWDPESKTYVAAFDPEAEKIASLEKKVAEDRGLFVFPDPYLYNPFRWVLDGDEEAEPPQDSFAFMCPACRKAGLRFHLVGHWD